MKGGTSNSMAFVGYILNPQMHCRPLMECISRMVEDKDEQTLIDVQIDDFKK